MKICEMCNSEHMGDYGSGRFCSASCARSYSTKNDIKSATKIVRCKKCLTSFETNKRSYSTNSVCLNCKETKYTHSKNSGCIRNYSKILLKCNTCDKIYVSTYRGKNRKLSKYCSLLCNLEYRENASKRMSEYIISGKHKIQSHKMIYKFNEQDIHCDSKIEYACLDYFEKRYKIINIQRCNFTIKYSYNNFDRLYVPDFKITTDIDVFIVEAKTFVTMQNLNEKWHFYNETSILKKEALQKYCKENGFTYFWFTKNLHRKFYDNIKF